MATKLAYHCDEKAPVCPNTYDITDAQSFAVAQVMLREAGWTHHDGNDYCPAHDRKDVDT